MVSASAVCIYTLSETGHCILLQHGVHVVQLHAQATPETSLNKVRMTQLVIRGAAQSIISVPS